MTNLNQFEEYKRIELKPNFHHVPSELVATQHSQLGNKTQCDERILRIAKTINETFTGLNFMLSGFMKYLL